MASAVVTWKGRSLSPDDVLQVLEEQQRNQLNAKKLYVQLFRRAYTDADRLRL